MNVRFCARHCGSAYLRLSDMTGGGKSIVTCDIALDGVDSMSRVDL